MYCFPQFSGGKERERHNVTITKKLLLGQIYSHITVLGTFIISASKNAFFHNQITKVSLSIVPFLLLGMIWILENQTFKKVKIWCLLLIVVYLCSLWSVSNDSSVSPTGVFGSRLFVLGFDPVSVSLLTSVRRQCWRESWRICGRSSWAASRRPLCYHKAMTAW